MTSRTTNLNLIKLSAGESLSADGYAFTTDNMDSIDRAFGIAVSHTHDGSNASLTDPVLAPVLVLDQASGSIPAGTTVKYKYSYIDALGQETAASPETTIATPSPVATPGSPSLIVDPAGGTLLAGNVYYALSVYVSINTSETKISPLVNSTLYGTLNSVELTFPSLPAGAEGYNIYRRDPGDATMSYLASVDMNVATPPTSYIDTGSVALDCNRTPSASNSTNQTNNITITLPGATPVVPTDATWRIYRTYTSSYASSILWNVVEETAEFSGIIVTSFLDMGFATYSGGPLSSANFLANPSEIILTDATETTGSLPPGLNIVPHEVTFDYAGPLAVVTGVGVWRCPFDKAQIQDISATLGVGFLADTADVIVDVNSYLPGDATPAWTTVYTTQGNRPTVPIGTSYGAVSVPDVVDLVKGDLLSVDIDQIGGGAPPTDEDLTVTISLMIQSGSLTTTLVL